MTNTIDLKKTITTLTITILLISTIAFITIQPASSAGGKKTIYYPSLVYTGDSIAEWVIDPLADGHGYVAKLTILADADWITSFASVRISYGDLLTTLDATKMYTFAYSTVKHGHYFVLYLDTTGDGLVDHWLADSTNTNLGFEVWQKGYPWDTWQLHNETGAYDWKSLGDWQSELPSTTEVIYISVGYGRARAVEECVFIDEVVINEGETDEIKVDFEPSITIEYNWYKMDDVVKVTVFDIGLNTRSNVKNDGTFIAVSNYPDQITVPILETGFDTSIFEGTFNLVKETPGANDLLVGNGNTTTVYYDRDEGFEPTVDDYAEVDTEAPIVDALSPEKNANVSDTYGFDVSAAVSNGGGSDIKTAWLVLDDIVRDVSTGDLSYTIPEVSPLAEGGHTVQVTAEDVAGNINVTTWAFTVDTVEPTCVISMNVTKSAVNATDAIEFTFKFSQDMETAPTIAGNATEYIELSEKGWKNATMYIANYTVSATEFNGTVLLNATGAVDVAENVMIPANFTFYIDTIAPTAPENLTATALVDSIVLEWDASEDLGSEVELYEIIRDETITVGSVDHPILTFTDTTLVESGIYFYQVRAYDFAGNPSILSEEANATFTVAPVTSYNITLTEGWNLISLPLIPDNSSVEAVLAGVLDNVTVVWSYNTTADTWLRYLPAVPELSELTEMVDGDGYWIKMKANVTLTVYGTELPEPPATPPVYHVNVGWNLIGFKSTEDMSVSRYLTTIPGELQESMVIYGWDATTQSYELVCVGEPNGEMFEPGQGYWLYITGEADIAPPLPS